MVDIIFSNNKLHKRDSKLAENKKCPIQGLLPDGLIVSIELDRVGHTKSLRYATLVLYQTLP